MRTIKITLVCLALGLVTVSCEKEMEEMDMQATSASPQSVAVAKSLQVNPEIKLKNPEELGLISESLRDYIVVNNAIEETDCGPTEFVAVQNKYIGQLGKEIVPVFGVDYANYLLSLYMDINFVAAYVDVNKTQYFGEKGEYTDLVAKRKLELEKFWNMHGQIRVNGQHSATLNDRNAVAYILYNFFTGLTSEEEAYAYADEFISLNAVLNTLPESPLFSLDGFATPGKLIVIGYGLVKMLSEAGVSQDIVWTGVLAHEWAHQIQFDNMKVWYPKGAADNLPEATRHTELEADFMAAYFMTHKRGATYNWKRVEQFNTLFFQIGDCGFESNGHHGTPAQRMAAAELGYQLANSAQKQGHIMTPEQLHEVFMGSVASIL